MTTDFSRLYAELGLHPDCTVQELSHAYRKRISALHPDHAWRRDRGRDGMDPADLISLYNRAMQFHRENGRLPGAPQNGFGTPEPVSAGRADDTPADDTPADSRPTDGPGRTPWRMWLLATVVLVLWLELRVGAPDAERHTPALPDAERSTAVDEAPAPAADRLKVEPELPDTLEIGMDSQTVRAIQGDPVRISDDVWEYGPSWIRIDRNRVVDWYSSPLYRLKTSSPTPTDDGAPELSH